MLTSFRGYVLASLALTTAVISHAVYAKRFFYRAVVHMSSSKFAILAVGNMGLVSLLLLWRAVQAVFLGPLRFREIERLQHRARDAIIECCFAMTIFRDEFNVRFLILVTVLLLVKSMHWLAKDRIEFLEEQPLTPARTHVRLVGLMLLLFAVDVRLVTAFAMHTFRARGPTMLVLFAFEFTVLLVELMSNVVRYVFHLVDLYQGGRWEAKGLYTFYNELLSDLCQLSVYVAFFLYVQFFYTFPLHIIRDLYLTFTKFQKRCVAFLQYRRVVASMDEVVPDATEEELAEGDRTCIICREEMAAAKKLNCGHMFHYRCLRSWLKRQLSCPTCRAAVDVIDSTPPAQNANVPALPVNNNNNNNENNNPNAQAQPAAAIAGDAPGGPAIHGGLPAGHPGQPAGVRDFGHPHMQHGQFGQIGQPARFNQGLAQMLNQWWNSLMANFAGPGNHPAINPQNVAPPHPEFRIPHLYAGAPPQIWRPVIPPAYPHPYYPQIQHPWPIPFGVPLAQGGAVHHGPAAHGPDNAQAAPTRATSGAGTHPASTSSVHGSNGSFSHAQNEHLSRGSASNSDRSTSQASSSRRPVSQDDGHVGHHVGHGQASAALNASFVPHPTALRDFVASRYPGTSGQSSVGLEDPNALLERLVILQERVEEMRASLDSFNQKFDCLREDLVQTMLVATCAQLERVRQPAAQLDQPSSSQALPGSQRYRGGDSRGPSSETFLETGLHETQPSPETEIAAPSLSPLEADPTIHRSEESVALTETESLRLRRLEFLSRKQNRSGDSPSDQR